MSARVLTQRELGRATLARQLLLQRATLPPPELLEHLLGLQAQEATSWYTGFWSRLEGFDPLEVSHLLESREIVRIALMRSTIHLVTATDALRLRPLLQPAVARPMSGRGRTELMQGGLDELAAAGRAVLDSEPLTSARLGAVLSQKWPAEDRSNLVMAVRVAVPLVQVPPRGIWGRKGAARHAPLESWVGRPLEPDYPIEELVRRYLAAFGPATPADASSWSGLSRMREVFERLRPDLETFRTEDGRELFDLPDAPRPPADTPAPPRFLADFDNVLLGHADRTRFISDEQRRWLVNEIGMYSYGSVLADGTVSGIWRIERKGDTATLIVKRVRALSREDEDAMASEASRLLAFWTPEIPDRDVRVVEALSR